MNRQTHELKTWPAQFMAIQDGRKRYEFRVDDRGFDIGDRLLLKEYDPEDMTYSGRRIEVEVTWITKGGAFGMPDGYCCMSIKKV